MRSTLRQTVVLMATISVIVMVLVCVMARLSIDYAAAIAFGVSDPPGPLSTVSDWPEPLQSLQADLTKSGEGAFVGFLLQGKPGVSSINEAVFRVEASEGLLKYVQDRLELVAVDKRHDRVAGWQAVIAAKASAEWWPDPSTSVVEYFASTGMLAGEEGDLYVAAYDRNSRVLFVLYQFNF